MPGGGFSIGFLDGLAAAVPVAPIVIHMVPRRGLGRTWIYRSGKWVKDDGEVA
jgi:hypothetical protein